METRTRKIISKMTGFWRYKRRFGKNMNQMRMEKRLKIKESD